MSWGAPGVILLVLLALLLFGPKKLPELGRAFGRTLKEFKAGTKELMDDADKTTSPIDVTPSTEQAEKAEKTNKRLPE